MKKYFNNWRFFLKEGIGEEVIDVLTKIESDKEKQPERARMATMWKQNPPTSEADWEKFKKWLTSEKDSTDPDELEKDYEEALIQKAQTKSKDTIAYNCHKLKRWLMSYEFKRVGTFRCSSLEEATQGLDNTGPKSDIFRDARFVKVIGQGQYGIATLFDNDHIVKIFKGGVHGGLEAELKTYNELLNSQYAGSAKAHDLAVYEYGTIPVYVRNAEIDMVDPIQYLGYAEIGKVIPFESWLEENFNENDAEDIKRFFEVDLYDGLSVAASASRIAMYGYLGRPAKGLKPHHMKPFDMVNGAAKEYANYIIAWILKRNLEKESSHVRTAGWAGSLSKHAETEDWWEMPAIPGPLLKGKGKKFLKDFFVALYDLSKMNGDKYLYSKSTKDVHTGNFGISFQTGKVIIFDR